MELQKGICSLCSNNKVITTSQVKNVFDVIFSLFSKEILNISELNNIQSSLKFCPICCHKLILLKCTDENIKTINIDDDEDIKNICVLCKSGKVLFKINKWAHFSKISEDLISKKEDDVYVTCSDCLFYLDTRNEIKSKLISKYPQLKVKPTNNNENKRRSRNNSSVLPHSPVASERKGRRSEGQKYVIKVSTEDNSASLKQKFINYDSLKKLKPLKQNKTFRRQEVVKSDSKFLNQIPCVLLTSLNAVDEPNHKNELNKTDAQRISANRLPKEKKDLIVSKHKSASPAIKMTVKKEIHRRRIYPKSIKLKKEITNPDIVKDLVVKLTKVNILQKPKTKSRHYKHDPEIENLIDRFNVLQSPTTASTSKISEESSKNDVSDLAKETNSVKTKRKSVSFADDIEYSQNDSSSDRREKLIENDSEKETLTKRNKIDDEKSVNSDGIGNSESGEADQNGEDVADETRATDDAEDKDSQAHTKTKWKIRWQSLKTTYLEKDTQDNEEREVEDKPKKEKPKPLSRKRSLESSDVEKTAQEHEKSEMEEDDKIEVEKRPEREKPKPLSKRKSVETSDFEDREKSEVEDDRPKRARPKPLSKKKSLERSDLKETSQDHEKSEVEESDKIEAESRPKRNKPKPLSKKKKRNSAVNSEDTTEKSTDKSNSESDKETIGSKSPDADSADQKAIGDNDENVLSNEQKEIELDRNTDVEDKPLSEVDNTDNTDGKVNEDVEEGTEAKSGKTSPKEDNERRSISASKEEDDDSGKENEDDVSKKTSEETTQLNDSKDSEENTNYSKSETGNDANLNDENKESAENPTEGSKTYDSGKKIDNFDSNSFSGSEKNDELGISEDDTNNINSILTGMFPNPEQSGDEELNEWKLDEKCSDKTNRKRKMSDELNNSTDKKKKKVTFCEDFT